LSLRDNENVWLVIFDEDLLLSEEAIFRDIKDKVAIHVSDDTSGVIDAHAVMVQTTSNDEILFLAILLGKENIVIDNLGQ
jgi:hypothetical protein